MFGCFKIRDWKQRGYAFTRYYIRVADDNDSLHYVFQFSNVSRPVVAVKQLFCGRRKHLVMMVFFIEFLDEKITQRGDILFAVS